MERQAKDGTIYQQVGQDQWTPVTRTAKDGTVYKKVGDDAWTPFDGSHSPSPSQSASVPQPPEQSMGEKVARGALKSLPYLGGLAGGVIGTPADVIAGPMGTVAGAGLGAAAGKSLENVLEKYLLGDQKTREDIYGGPVKTGLDMAAAEGAGQIIGKIPGLVKAGVNSAKNLAASKLGQQVEYTSVPNADAIKAAAQKLGIDEVPKAVLTDNPTYQKLESGLSQSGSLPAKSTRDQYNKFFKGVDQASQKIADMKTPDSDHAIGQQIQSQLSDDVNGMKAPVSEMYNNFSKDLRKIPVDEGVVNRAFGSLKKNPLFQTKDGLDLLEQYKSAAKTQPNIASLKEFRSTLGDSVGPTASPLDAKRIDAIRGAVTSIRDNSINAMKAQFPKSAHGEIDGLINEISLADAAHAGNVNDINSVKSIIGNKDISSPSTFLNKLGDMKEADIAQRASNLDVGTLQNLKDKFPGVYTKVKTATVNDMIQRSSPGGNFNENTFLRLYEKLGNEEKQLIFDPEVRNQIDAFKTVKQAIPPKLGPSGTPEGKMMMDMVNPHRNALDFGVKKALEQSVNGPAQAIADKVPTAVPAVKKVSPVLQMIPRSFDRSASVVEMPKAADNSTPTKGPDKWASDGLQKLNQHSSDSSFLQQVSAKKDDPKVKDLLIKASDLKPGTKAMEDILSKLKARVSGGGE